MFTYVEVSKNTYPYRTLHVDTCGVLKRASYPHVMTLEQVRRMDGVRLDICSRCMPVRRDPNNGASVYSEGQRNFWSIQRAFREEEAATWQRIHAARKVVALRVALAEAEAAIDPNDPFLATTEAEVAAGHQYALEVTVGRR